MREEIYLVGIQDPAQVGMCRDRVAGSRFLIQRHESGVLVVCEFRPTSYPIFDICGQPRIAWEAKNHKMGVGSGPRGQGEGLRASENRKAPHQMAELEVSFKTASQVLVKTPGPLSAGEILVDQDCTEWRPLFRAEATVRLADNWAVHEE